MKSTSNFKKFAPRATALAVWFLVPIPSSQASTTVDVPPGNLFVSGSIDYSGLEFLLHIPGKGNVWLAIPTNHDLETGPVTPVAVLDPAGTDPVFVGPEERPSIASLQAQIDALRQDSSQALKPMQPFIGEIRLFAGPRLPKGWAYCDGRLLAIRESQDLFEAIGNTYGGDGLVTLGLPDLRGRVPMGRGAGAGLTNRKLGEEPGAETVILDVTQMPSHDHTLRATNSSATQTQPAGNVLATASTPQYLNASTSVVMGTDAIGASGSNAPHANIPPSTVLSYGIAVHSYYARTLHPNASKWPVSPGVAPPRWPVQDIGAGTAVTLDPTTDYPWVGRLEIFVSGAVDYMGFDIIEHEDGVGTIWIGLPRNHNLTAGPVTPLIVLNPDVGEGTGGDGRTTITLEGHGNTLFAIRQVLADFGLGDWAQGVAFNYGDTDGVIPRTTVDRHAGLQFTSGAVDYLGLEMIEHEDGVGTIWLAIPKNHDLETGPVTPVIVLAPDVVTPV